MRLSNMHSERRSILTSWLASYFIVLLIPIVINIFVFFNTVRTVENEVNSSNIALLTQLQRIIDDQIHQAENLCLQINWNSQIKALINSKGKFQNSEHYDIIQVLNDFKAYITNNFIDSFYVYLKNSNTILGDTFLSDIDLVYDTIHKNDNITFTQWEKMIGKKHELELIPLIRKDVNGKSENIIVFAQTLPLENPREVVSNIFITLNPKPIYEFVNSINWINKGDILISDRNNNIIFSDKAQGFNQALQSEKPQLPEGISYRQLNGQNVVISCVSSDYFGMKYVSVLPVSIFTEKVDYIWKLTIISMLLCLLLGGIVSFWFSKKEYNIINGIVAFLAGKIGINKNVRHNEYQFIKDAMSRVFNEKELIDKKLQQQVDVLRNNFLIRLLKGRMENLNLPGELLPSMHIDFKSESFAVLLFSIDSYNMALFEKDADCNSEYSMETKLTLLVNSVVEEFISEKNQVFAVEMDKMTAYLINFGILEEENHETDLKNAVVEIKHILQERYQIDITVSVSSVYRGVNNISKAYGESMDAMEYKMVLGKGEIINYNKIKEIKCNEYTYFYPLNTEMHLINYVKTGDLKSVEKIITDIFDNNLLKSAHSIQIVKCLMVDLICTIIKTINELGNSCESSFLEGLNPIKKLLNCETIKEMKFQITDILMKICENIELQKKSHNSTLKENIIQYMEAHYSDSNLNITTISERFHINPAYLSRFFKEQTGECVLDYLNRVRLDNAKRLMKERKMCISDTAAAVGYNNSNTFIRIFKKYEGITPGNYKD